MNSIQFGIIGGGWRAEFFLRIARELPHRFKVSGVMVRDAAKARLLQEQWRVPTLGTLDDLLATNPLFVVVSVPWAVAPQMTEELAHRGVPVLSETPPAPSIEGLKKLHHLVEEGAKIQVAEQYHLQPLHAARIAIAASGRLGVVSQAQVSAAHGYHGISLMRRLLGIGFQNATITARGFSSSIMTGPGRDGPPAEEKTEKAGQTIAFFDFGDKWGVFDFAGPQYFSPIRSPRVLVRGERGEINDTRVRYLQDFRTPIEWELVRQDAGHNGNLEGFYHKGILAGDDWIYRNPFVPARLADDEIAVASCLEKMASYIEGGPGFYSLAEAAQDHYLSLMMEQSLVSHADVTTETQEWAE